MKNRFLLIFVCIFTAIVLTFGTVMGISMALKDADAVVKCGKVVMDEGVVRYLAASYKVTFIRTLRASGVGASDTESFWNGSSDDGRTWGEVYRESLSGYLRSVAASANVYLKNSSYTAEDKRCVRETAEEFLHFRADGSVARFNEMSAKYGFDYDDFCNAAAILYKSDRAKEITYGAEGEGLKAFPSECEKYLKTYSRVSLLFVRTEETFQLDEEGNRVYDEKGNAILRDMTEEEKAERRDVIDTLSAAIEAKKNGGDKQITTQMFELFLEKSDGDPKMHEVGYYFNESSKVTAEFASEFPEVVEAALEMELYEYEKVDCSIGVCFIYKYDVEKGAYSDEDNVFFDDFYINASDYLYADNLKTLSEQATVTEKYDTIDVLAIPSLSDFVIREWK